MARPGMPRHPCHPSTMAVSQPFQLLKGSRSELGRQVAVDLETDADLHKDRSGPGHCWFPKVWLSGMILVRSGYRRKPARYSPTRESRTRVDSRARFLRGCICAAKNARSTLAIWLKPRSRTGRGRLLTTRRHTSPIRPHWSRLTRRQQVGPQCARIEFVIDAHAHNIVRDVRIEVDCKRCRIRWQAGGCRNLAEVQV